MTFRTKTLRAVAPVIALLGLVSCQDTCHDGDPSTCCCRDRWGMCKDPSNGDLPDEDVTCAETRVSTNSQSGSSGSSAPVNTSPPPTLGQLPAPYAPSGYGNGTNWQWTVDVGPDVPVKLCCAEGHVDPGLDGNCQEVHWRRTTMQTTTGQVLSCRTSKTGWTPSSVGTIGYTAP